MLQNFSMVKCSGLFQDIKGDRIMEFKETGFYVVDIYYMNGEEYDV